MKYIKYIIVAAVAVSGTACHNWLTEETPGTTSRDAYFATAAAAVEVVNAAYTPLMWEFGTNTTYYSEWFIGDIVSDDALKGGQSVTDMGECRDMENFKTNTNNKLLLGFYRAQWSGVARANLALDEVPKVPLDEVAGSGLTEELRDRLMGEAYFLRAYYYFRLVRVFGGMPLIDYVVDSSGKWAQKRTTRDETFKFILADLERAEKLLIKRSEYTEPDDMGRATKGAAQAMLMKVNLYRAGFLAQEGNTTEAQQCYTLARDWGKKVIESNEYSLLPAYATLWTMAGENSQESVFEIQYTEDPMSDYGEGEGFTRGTFTTILQRPRTSAFGGAGWGFDKPTQNLYDEFEARDLRRPQTILNPTDEQIQNPSQEIYLGTRYCSRKHIMLTDGKDGKMYDLSHATRSPRNYPQIRYADVLLMYAEACCELNELDDAIVNLNKVRKRVRLNGFPYTAVIQGKEVTFARTQADLRTAIRHERRVELAMEGQRWFDLCRWGIAAEVMTAYLQTETDEVKAEVAPFQKGKHELFPIPADEIALSGIEQNFGY